jgi:hypothetical protein
VEAGAGPVELVVPALLSRHQQGTR